MLDLYWQFAAWAYKPLVLTNWLSVLSLVMVVGLLYQIQRTLHGIHVIAAKVADELLADKEK